MLSTIDKLEEILINSNDPKEEDRSKNDNFKEDADGLSRYMDQLSHHPVLSADEELEIAKKAHDGDFEARTRMIECNLRLVVYFARRYRNHGASYEDLIQEGNIGLMKAVDNYDCTRGIRFSSYAAYWIKVYMIRLLYDKGAIRVPIHMMEKINKVYRLKVKTLKEKGREPSVQEIAETLKLSEKQVKKILDIQFYTVSFETPIGDDDSVLGDLIPDTVHMSPAANVFEDSMKEDIIAGLGSLTDREADIIRLRYGLDNEEAHSLEQISKKYHLTRERIRQITKKSLKKLYDYGLARGWDEYMTCA